MTPFRTLLPTALLGSLLALGCAGGGSAPRLEGAGSTFIDPMMQEWVSLFEKAKGGQVNYQAKGSGAGIKMMIDKEVDFGCTDAPLNEEQLAKAREAGGDVVHVPLVMGAIVPAYNLPEVPDLVFTGKVLIDVYLGKITRWNDPALQALNPGKPLPDKAIAPVFRSDSSGSTYILTDYFTKIDQAAWTPGRGTAVEWAKGVGRKGNDGVAGFIKETDGALGYVELIYALKTKLPYGAVINAKGKPIKADLASVTAAAATAEIPDDLRYSITNASGEAAYPISGTVWALVYTRQPANRARVLADFLGWVTHDGQPHAEKLHYARLPEALVKKVEGKLAQIQAK